MKKFIVLLFVLIIFPMTLLAAEKTVVVEKATEKNITTTTIYTDYVRDSYATIKLGMFMPNDDYNGLNDFNNDFAIGCAIGHKFNRNFAVELGLEYFSTDIDDNYYDTYCDITTFGIPLTAKFIIPVQNNVNIFVGAGFGLYFTDAGFNERYYHNNVDGVSFGLHGLIGADVKINQNMFFTTELKYTEVDQDLDEYGNWEVGGTTFFMGVKFLL